MARQRAQEMRWRLLLAAQAATLLLIVVYLLYFLPRPAAALLLCTAAGAVAFCRNALRDALAACTAESPQALGAINGEEAEAADAPIWRGNSAFAHVVRRAPEHGSQRRCSRGTDSSKGMLAAMESAKSQVADGRQAFSTTDLQNVTVLIKEI